MNEIINFELQLVEIGEYEQQTVDGRHLQKELESTRNYSDWAKYQIYRLNLVENED